MKHSAHIIVFTMLIGALLSGTASGEEVLRWEDCVGEAAKHHPDLIAAVENIKQEKAVRNAVESGLLPQVSGDMGMSRAQNSSTSSTTGRTTESINNAFTYGMAGSQLIFDGFATYNNFRAAGENVRASEQGYDFVSSTVRLDLRTAFINLLRAQALIDVNKDIIKIRKKDLDLITLRYKSGLEHKGAFMLSQADLAGAYFNLSQTQREILVARRQLTKEMGRAKFIPMSVDGDFIVHDKAPASPDLGELAGKHPSVMQAAFKAASADMSVKSAVGSFVPQVTGSAGTDKSGSAWPPSGNEWNLGFSITMPFFDGGYRLAELANAKAAYRQALEAERSTRDATIVSLEKAWTSLQDVLEAVRVQKKVLAASEERSRIAAAQYSTGFINFDNWIIIQNDLVSAKRNYLNLEADALQAEANWINAKGETLEYAQ